jgi:tetratricopeptide (TPR) repeat protein
VATRTPAGEVVGLFLTEAEAACDEGQFGRALSAAGRAVTAASQARDALLLVRALSTERMILRSAGDYGGALVRSTQILAMADDPATRGQLDGPVAIRAIANAYLEFVFSGRMHGRMPLRELLKVLDTAENWLTATGHQDWRAAVLMERAEIYSALGDTTAALGLAQEALAVLTPGTPGFSAASYRNSLGSMLTDAGRLAEAAEQFEKVLADPSTQVIDRVVARNHLGRAALDDGDPAGARQHAEASVQLAEGAGDASAASAWGLLARARAACGDHDGARQAAEQAVAAAQRAGGQADLYYATRSAFDVALRGRDFDTARELVEQAAGLAASLDKAQGRVVLTREVAQRRRRLASDGEQQLPAGRAGWAAGLYEQSVTEYSRIIDADPGVASSYAGRGETYRLTGRYAEAVADFSRAVELDPGFAWAWGSRGQAYRALGQHAAAIADLSHALELDPGATWALADRSRSYRDTGRYAEALAGFGQILATSPGAPWLLASRGETYRLMGRYDEALADFSRVVETDPRHAWALASRGQVYRATGRLAEAVADLDAALAIDPGMRWAARERDQVRRELDSG